VFPMHATATGYSLAPVNPATNAAHRLSASNKVGAACTGVRAARRSHSLLNANPPADVIGACK
jgi:hypothetical protein